MQAKQTRAVRVILVSALFLRPYQHCLITRLGHLATLQMGLSVMQVYQQVHALLPDVHYSALAKVLSLKTPGKRKQERLPGDISLHAHHPWPPSINA